MPLKKTDRKGGKKKKDKKKSFDAFAHAYMNIQVNNLHFIFG